MADLRGVRPGTDSDSEADMLSTFSLYGGGQRYVHSHYALWANLGEYHLPRAKTTTWPTQTSAGTYGRHVVKLQLSFEPNKQDDLDVRPSQNGSNHSIVPAEAVVSHKIGEQMSINSIGECRPWPLYGSSEALSDATDGTSQTTTQNQYL